MSGSSYVPAFDSEGRDRNGQTVAESIAHIQDLVRRGHGGETGAQRERYRDAIARELRTGERPTYGPSLMPCMGLGRSIADALGAQEGKSND